MAMLDTRTSERPATAVVGVAPRRRFWNPLAWGSTFEALEEPAFAKYFTGTLAFFFAMQMQMLLRGYLIYDLTNDAFSLGLISITFAAPMLVLAPVAGVVADRVDRQRIIVVSQSIGLALTALTTVLILTGVIQFWHLLIISLFSSSTMVFNMPARQALVPSLVPPHRMMNAIALNSGAMNASRIVAPAMAGVLVAPLGIGGAYIVTMCFTLAAVLLFLNVRVPARASDGHPKRSFFGDMAEGVAYVRGDRLLIILLIVGTVPMLLAMPHQNLLPVFAVSVWDVGASGLGLLQTMAGVGGLVGTVIAANLGSVRKRATVMTASMVAFGLCILTFASSPAFAFALPFMLFGDMFAMMGQTLNNTVIQSAIPDRVRGRVMALLMMTFGVTPFGTLPASWIAQQYGVRWAVGGGAAILVVFALLIWVVSRTFRNLDHGLPTTDEATLRPMRA